MTDNIQPKEAQQSREPISLDNIGSLYLDIQSAMAYADVSKPTLYKYINEQSNNIIKYKIKNNTYLHIEDIERIKKETNLFKEKHARVSKEVALDDNTTVPADYIKNIENENERFKKQLDQEQSKYNQLREENIKLSEYKIKYEQQEQDYASILSRFIDIEDEVAELKKYKELYNQLIEKHNDLQNKYDNLIEKNKELREKSTTLDIINAEYLSLKEKYNELDKTYRAYVDRHTEDLATKCSMLIQQAENYQVLLKDKTEDKSIDKLIGKDNDKKSFWSRLIGK